MKNRNSKKENNYYPKDTLTANSDVLIICIGFSLIILGFLGISYEVPEEFVIGASLAGMLFGISDYITTLEKISDRKIGIYAMCLVFGAFSVVAVPPYLMVEEEIGNFIVPYSDTFSMIALGLVIMSIGNRIREARSNQINNLNKIIDELRTKESS